MTTPTFNVEHNLRFEHIPTKIFPDSLQASKAVANEIAALIKEKAAKNEVCVLGLATGSTPKTLYNELVRLHQEEGLRHILQIQMKKVSKKTNETRERESTCARA